MIKIKTENAVGKILGYDITEIIPGKLKGTKFRKGHLITEKDIALLKKIGRDHIYIYKEKKGWIHEEIAATELAKTVSGKNLFLGPAREGAVEIFSKIDGFFMADKEKIDKLNLSEDIILSTLKNLFFVKKNGIVAKAKIVPLLIKEITLKKIQDYKNIINVYPVKLKKAALIITGNEVYNGLIKDGFYPLLIKKLKPYGNIIIHKEIAPDDTEYIEKAFKHCITQNPDYIMISGGMAVDPEDKTKNALKRLGVKKIRESSPILPGAMFFTGYYGPMPVIGIPGGALFDRITALDVILPYILAKVKLNKKIIASFGYGGLCQKCKICNYPLCYLGKN